MKKLVFALATIAGLGFAAPAFAASAPSADGARVHLAQLDVRIGEPRRSRSRVIIRDRDRDFRRGRSFRDDRRRGSKTTIIKRRGDGTVVKKTYR